VIDDAERSSAGSEVEYNYYYLPYLNPSLLPLLFANAGIRSGPVKTACELGFGQGINLNVHAAASSTHWYGTDFNPAHARFATDLASASGAPAVICNEPFEIFCARTDLPDFDFIALHGVWSWVSQQNQSIIRDFIVRKLAPGGVLFLSYNVMAGDAAMVPVREVMARSAAASKEPAQPLDARIGAALRFAASAITSSPNFADAHPGLAGRVQSLASQNWRYVAHEYFAHNWEPASFGRIADWLRPAGLEYACSSGFGNTYEPWNLTPAQRDLLATETHPELREMWRDIMTNNRFRREYWVRGARRFTPSDRLEALRRQRVLLVAPRDQASVRAETTLGAFALPKAMSDRILDLLSDHKPVSIGQIESSLRGHTIGFQQIIEVIFTLLDSGELAVAQREEVTRVARSRTDKLNAFLAERARSADDPFLFASPVTGAAILHETRMPLLFWTGLRQGLHSPAELAAKAAALTQDAALPPQGAEGKRVELDVLSLRGEAEQFLRVIVPLYRALQVV